MIRTMKHNIPEQYHIAHSSDWSVNQRIDSVLPGYLMIASTHETNDLSDFPESALSSMGVVLARVQQALTSLGANRVYIGRYGHSPGYPFHFHAIPIYDWVEELFWSDVRYRMLEQLAGSSERYSTNGAEITLFVWREFCEGAYPAHSNGLSVGEAVEYLRQTIKLL